MGVALFTFSLLLEASSLIPGGLAQLGERCVRNAEVVGSNPISSIYFFLEKRKVKQKKTSSRSRWSRRGIALHIKPIEM